MARLLYRLGRWAAAHPGRVVLAWALLLVLAAVLGAGLPLLTALIGEAIGVLGVEFVLAKLAAASGDLAQGRPEPDPALGRTTRAHRAERSAASRG